MKRRVLEPCALANLILDKAGAKWQVSNEFARECSAQSIGPQQPAWPRRRRRAKQA